ncbi:MAG: PEP-CTERM sorting domain-containing protein [Phycisphaerales bacterium JB038]
MKLLAFASVCALAATTASGAFFSDFEANDGGLAGTGDWEWGMPIGANGSDLGGFGGDEPTGGFSGDNVWGTVLGGLHSPSLVSTLTLAGQNLSLAETLSFQEWIDSGSNSFDTAKVFVDGTEVYFSDGASGSAWRPVVIDLTSFSGTGDIVFEFSTTSVVERVGWYIDDLSVRDVPAPGTMALLGLAGLVARRRR